MSFQFPKFLSFSLCAIGLYATSSFAGGTKPSKDVPRAERRVSDYEKQIADLESRITKAEEGSGDTRTTKVTRGGRTFRETTTSIEDLETLRKDLEALHGNVDDEKKQLRDALNKYDADIENIVNKLVADNGGDLLETTKVAAVAIQRLKAHRLEGRYSDLLLDIQDKKTALQTVVQKINQSNLGAYTTARLAGLMQSKEFCEAAKRAQSGSCAGPSLYEANMQNDLKHVIEGTVAPAEDHLK